jgi:hypothetical protein
MSSGRRRIWGGFAGIVGVLCALLAGCAGGGASLVIVTPTPICPGTPPTVVSGTVQEAAPGTATISADAATVTIIHFTTATRFSQVNLADASALIPGERAQILVQPSAGAAIPTARAIVVQSDQAAAAPTGCTSPAQAGEPEIQGTIANVNTTSQQVTLVDDHAVPYVLLFSSATIIGQPEPAQQSDIQRGNLVLASGTATPGGITADLVIILTTTTA